MWRIFPPKDLEKIRRSKYACANFLKNNEYLFGRCLFVFSSAITKQRDRLVLCYILLSFKRPQKFHIQQTILFVLNSL